jgi:hypothetical protein
MEDRNGGAIMAIGGVITVVIIAMWAMKFVQAMFIQLGKTCDAFAVMVTSVVGSLWALAQVAMLGSLIVGSVVAAAYFTYKYILMVKRGTELQKAVASQISELRHTVSEQLHDFRTDIENKVNGMRMDLNEALKEPDAVPVIATQPSVELLPPGPEGITDERDSSNPGDTDAAMNAVSNPF